MNICSCKTCTTWLALLLHCWKPVRILKTSESRKSRIPYMSCMESGLELSDYLLYATFFVQYLRTSFHC